MNSVLQKKTRTTFLALGSVLFVLSFLLGSNKGVLLGSGMITFLFYWILKYPLGKGSFIFLMLAFGVLASLMTISSGMDMGYLQGLSILLAGLLSLIAILKTTAVGLNFRSMKKRSSVLIGLVFMITTILLSLGYVEAGEIVAIVLIVLIAVGFSVRLIIKKREGR